MKNRIVALMLMLVMLISVVPAMADEEVTLTWVGAGWLQNDKAGKIIAKWNAIHPDIKVNYVDQGNTVDQAYLTNFDVMVGGGQVVDVTYMTYGDVYNRILNGGALPLDEYIAAAGDDYEAMYGSLTTTLLNYNGSIYGVPYAGNTFKVFYNKDMVAAKGITIPETWSIEEFREIAKQLTDKENGINGVTFPYGWQDIIYAPANLSGWFMTKRDADGNIVPNFEDETFKKVMQWAKDLADVDGSSPSLATIMAESINRRRTLMTGTAAMILDGPYTLVWTQNYMFNDPGEGKLNFELGVAELPYATEDGKNVSYNTIAGAFYVPKLMNLLSSSATSALKKLLTTCLSLPALICLLLPSPSPSILTPRASSIPKCIRSKLPSLQWPLLMKLTLVSTTMIPLWLPPTPCAIICSRPTMRCS